MPSRVTSYNKGNRPRNDLKANYTSGEKSRSCIALISKTVQATDEKNLRGEGLPVWNRVMDLQVLL